MTPNQNALAALPRPITPEDVAHFPSPGMAVPGDFAFSHDDRLIAFLFSTEGTLERQLYAYDVETGDRRLLFATGVGETSEEKLSLEEKLRRERRRQLATGVTRYSWDTQSKRILLPMSNGIYVMDDPDSQPRLLVDGEDGPLLDPRLSPDGRWIAFVRDGEIYLAPFDGGEPRQLTKGARESGLTHGLAEFMALEEMSRYRGYWWSPDSQWLAFTRVDETNIPVYRIVHQGEDTVGPAAQEDHRYPFAGQENARVDLGIISVEGGAPAWLDLDGDGERYLARVRWLPDGSLSAQLVNREQTRLDLVRFKAAGGERELLLTETSEVWVNLHNDFRPLKKRRDDGAAFVWSSERTGYRHLYLYDRNGELLQALTSGRWQVDNVVGVDEKKGIVYFTGTLDGPTERHLYAIPFEGGEPRRITSGSGNHQVVLSRDRSRFVDTYLALDNPPAITLRALEDGRTLKTLHDQTDSINDDFSLQPPQLEALRSRDGETLYGAVYRPPASFGDGPHPLIVSVYGGPHSQRVINCWTLTSDMRAQYLSRLGYLVFRLDNRGSSRRGLEFERAIKHKLGGLEVRDQVDGVRWLVRQGLADPQRVGIFGGSYGGYMALMCMAQAPETFKAAVAIAPVTSWDGYDTFYTERYMGTPQSNPNGYRESSVLNHLEGIKGNLLLVHGLLDENVHFRHTARLIKALIAAGKDYEFLLFPDGRHSLRKETDRVYLEERIGRFFLQHL